MTVSHLLEDFGTVTADLGGAITDAGLTANDAWIEEEKLAAFEKGYQAGWDDSLRAQEESHTRISEDFARNIRDLSFTYEEAHSALLADMEQLIGQIVDTVVPALARETIGLRVVEILKSEIAAQERQPVRLVTAPGQSDALRNILPDENTLPLVIEEDTSLAEGQVHLRFASGAGRELDINKVLAGIATAVKGFFHEAKHRFKETA